MWGSPLHKTITIIITANGNCNVKYIKDSVESVLRQTTQNFELIIVDHGCELVQRETIWQYFIANSKIKLVSIDQNIHDPRITSLFGDRVFNAINAGLFCSEGDYAYFLSYDDYLSDNYVESMLPLFLNNSNCVVASPAVASVNHLSELNEDTSKMYFDHNIRPTYLSGIELATSVMNGGKLFMAPGGYFCCKTDIVLANGGFDCIFDLSQIFKFAVLGDVGTNTEAVLYWRHHEKQTNKMNKKSGALLYSLTTQWIIHIRDFYHKNNLPKNYQDAFYKYIYKDLKLQSLSNIQDSIRTGIKGSANVLGSILSEAPIIYIFYFILLLIKNLPYSVYASMPEEVKKKYRDLKILLFQRS